MKRTNLLSCLLLVFSFAAMTFLYSATSEAQTELTLYNFTGGSDGGDPLSNLVMDPAGNLYGTTFVAGAYGAGEVFELKHNSNGGWAETVLYSFTGGADGANPYYAGVVFDASGNLYGTTVGGGSSNFGTVFELMRSGSNWDEKVLYSFAGGADGASPYAGLLFDTAGNLYGTTYYGGSYNDGTVFELMRGSDGQWTEELIYTFDETNGDSPAGGLIFDREDNLYGVTQGGGDSNAGVAYKLTPSSSGGWNGQTLYSFTGGTDGSGPYAERLVFDRKGNLYGTTNGGGAFQAGTVFQLSRTKDFWKETVLYSFDPSVAGNPTSGLIFDSKENLYGTCANGNGESTVGALFKLSPKSSGEWSERNLVFFDRTDGEFPEGSLLGDSAGNIYGTTWLGGAENMGVVFEIIP
jgi:uncharacterized repeat protein (TIGR03803 family)